MRLFRRYIFSIPYEEATFVRRGFREGNAGVRQRLEQVGRTFLQGYHAALDQECPDALAFSLNSIEDEFRGFGFEGAAMALALLDSLTPWKKQRWSSFLRGPAADHIYMVHVGLGWAIARLHRRPRRLSIQMDPLLCWLALDGYGFHQGYFYSRRYVEEQQLPKALSGYACHAFDQGLGRSLWFVECADVVRIPKVIASFHPSRVADLWSGLGLACAYAGGADRQALEALRARAGSNRPHLAQGVAFATKARQRAKTPSFHTDLACEVICGLSSQAAESITDSALENLTTDGTVPEYEVWRCRVQAQFAGLGG